MGHTVSSECFMLDYSWASYYKNLYARTLVSTYVAILLTIHYCLLTIYSIKKALPVNGTAFLYNVYCE
jgi:hypothetical protein